jgi:hypothetical protein
MILCAAQSYTQMRTAKPLHKLTRSSPIDVMEWPHLGGGARERSARGKRNQFRDMNSCCSMVAAAARVASAIAEKITMRGMRLRLQEGRRDILMESLVLSILNARIIKASVPRFLSCQHDAGSSNKWSKALAGCALVKAASPAVLLRTTRDRRRHLHHQSMHHHRHVDHTHRVTARLRRTPFLRHPVP